MREKCQIFYCYCSIANGILFFCSVLRRMGLSKKVFNLRVTPTILLFFFCYRTRINSYLKFILEMKSYYFFTICIILSSHCGIANGSLKSFPSNCMAVPQYLKNLNARFIFNFVTCVKSHIVSCSIVKHGIIPYQPFHLNFEVLIN